MVKVCCFKNIYFTAQEVLNLASDIKGQRGPV
jgi:hypothetical protein